MIYSPFGAGWKNMIKFYNLEGSHIRANAQLIADLRKLFDNNGSIYILWYNF